MRLHGKNEAIGRTGTPVGAAPMPARSDPEAGPDAQAPRKRRPRILIADKNPVMRAGLQDFVKKDGRFEVMEIVSTGNAFVAGCDTLRPDIGIIGWSLPDMTGADVLAAIKRRQAKTRIIVYTGDTSLSVLRQCVKQGAWGFMLKSDDPAFLLDTIAAVARGRLSLPYVDIGALASDPLETLTKRERELLRALANGLTNEQIAARIGISHNTVKYHLKNLYDKLGVKNRAMAVALYMTIPEEAR